MNKLYIIRGIPGSGKSTLANKLKNEIGNCEVYENDMYFIKNVDGKEVYDWKAADMPKAIEWCRNHVYQALNAGKNCIVANTFTTMKEIVMYTNMAMMMDIEYEIIKCDGGFINIHSVPNKTLERMKARWVGVEGEKTYNVKTGEIK